MKKNDGSRAGVKKRTYSGVATAASWRLSNAEQAVPP